MKITCFSQEVDVYRQAPTLAAMCVLTVLLSTNDDAVKMLVANKIDKVGCCIVVACSMCGGVQEAQREVTKQEGAAFARSNNMLFIEARLLDCSFCFLCLFHDVLVQCQDTIRSRAGV